LAVRACVEVLSHMLPRVLVVTDAKGRVQGVYDAASGRRLSYDTRVAPPLAVPGLGASYAWHEAAPMSTRSEQEAATLVAVAQATRPALMCRMCDQPATEACAACTSRHAVYCGAVCATAHWHGRHYRKCRGRV
jgi:hypothetical protein